MTSRTAQRKRSSSKAKAAQQRRKSARARRSSVSRYRLAAIGAVVAIVGTMVALSVFNRGGTAAAPGTGDTGAAGDTAQVIDAVTAVPAVALDTVGAGQGINAPGAIAAGAPAVTSGGKPEILYIGAEYCPFCASQRWPLVIALSRFGTFSGLGLTTSSASDVYPSTPTLAFHGSTYASDVISFVPVETETNQPAASGIGYEPLETLTADQQRLMQTFDVPPYTSQAGSIPFVLIGNRFVVTGSSYPPDVLQGMTWQQIASALSDPSSLIAKQVLAAANMLTATICQLTDQQPSNVCTSSGVSSATGSLLPA
ncbi:MAG: DUF929 family protein [Actinomycetota bacterium]